MLLSVLPWLVLSVAFLILAALTDSQATTSSGRRLDTFFLVMGVAFSLPLVVMAVKRHQTRR